jgi:hypothetical protein
VSDLDELLERVLDRDSFLAFVRGLVADRVAEAAKEREQPSSAYGLRANGWENGTIEAYLDAALAWTEDNQASLFPGRAVLAGLRELSLQRQVL